MSTWSVVLGGVLALAGTVVTQLTLFAVARSGRSEAKRVAASEFERSALARAEDAANTYRKALSAYGRAITAANLVDPATDEALRLARMDYEASVHRLETSVRDQFMRWAVVAVSLANQEASAENESTRWNEAMMSCASATRETFR